LRFKRTVHPGNAAALSPRLLAGRRALVALLILLLGSACGPGDARPRLTFSGSALGTEGAVIRQQLARFAERHPDARVELRVTPDAANHRHQLYVQWLNARVAEPDVLQLDIIWTAEFAAAGWILPLDTDEDDFFPAALEANRWRGTLYAVPWFADAGLLYWRTDLFDRAPGSYDELRANARAAVDAGHTRYGLVWQGARYEGLVTVFLEHLTATGGRILDEHGAVVVDDPRAVRALALMTAAVHDERMVPASALTWQEEQVRFAFQNGQAAFMRNWPYAWALLQDAEQSAVAGRVGIAPFPAAEGGRPAAALGGAQLAVNRHSAHPDLARALVQYLTAPEQMLERAQLAAQLPARRSLYESAALEAALPLPLAEARAALDSAVPRPVTPVYSELSELLQVQLHRALTRQQTPEHALREAAREMRALLARVALDTEGGP
jgi:ABC-type glycerol-3-phosphate transport system substrate-binding protein